MSMRKYEMMKKSVLDISYGNKNECRNDLVNFATARSFKIMNTFKKT